MRTLDELVTAITLGTSEASEAEAAFADYLAEQITCPLEFELLGVRVHLTGFERTPRHERLRADLNTPSGELLQVSLDALQAAPDSTLGVLVAAYRRWLGLEVSEDLEAEAITRVYPGEKSGARLEELEARIKACLGKLRALDMSELETWLGDDDPGGHNEKYWPQGMHVFKEQIGELFDLVRELEEFERAGMREELVEPVEAILCSMERCTFEYFCPYKVSSLATNAIRLWLALLEEDLDEEAAAGQVAWLSAWIETFELDSNLERIVRQLPQPMEEPLLRWLEGALETGRRWRDTQRVSALRQLRLKREQHARLLEQVPIGSMSHRDVLALMDHLLERDQPRRALEVAGDWLEEEPGDWKIEEVSRRRRHLLAQLGEDPAQILEEAWESFSQEPSPEGLRELRSSSPQSPERVDAQALEHIHDQPYVILGLLKEIEPGEVFIAWIEEQPIEVLKAVSSWTLQDVAPALEASGPAVAAKVYTALGWRHLDRGKAKYYSLAVDAFAHARRLYLELGRQTDWDRVVEEVTEAHGQKYSFMPRFRELSTS